MANKEVGTRPNGFRSMFLTSDTESFTTCCYDKVSAARQLQGADQCLEPDTINREDASFRSFTQ